MLSTGSVSFTSPESLSTFDEYSANPLFVELQEELRTILFTGASRAATPEEPDASEEVSTPRPSRKRLDLSRTSIPLRQKLVYLQIWNSECAPWLDMFDIDRHFGIQVPIMAHNAPALLYSLLALSARQMERQRRLKGAKDSLELYQEAISLLAPMLESKDANALTTACILCALEMMSVSPRDWRRHVEGCAALFESFGVNGFSGGLPQAVFWCYARMDLCGAIISDGTESTVLPIYSWVECPSEAVGLPDREMDDAIKAVFLEKGKACADMHANYAVYLCAKVCDLVCRRTRNRELGELNGCSGQRFTDQWNYLWDELDEWMKQRPHVMLPVKTTPPQPSIASSNLNARTNAKALFPQLFFAHFAAISSTQLYHTACIMLLEIEPNPSTRSCSMTALAHAQNIVAISLTNPHPGCLNNAIQPLFVAGRYFSHISEHIVIAKLIMDIESATGWGVVWRLRDLERVWGYDRGELGAVIEKL